MRERSALISPLKSVGCWNLGKGFAGENVNSDNLGKEKP
jgi:hypothetical protein